MWSRRDGRRWSEHGIRGFRVLGRWCGAIGPVAGLVAGLVAALVVGLVVGVVTGTGVAPVAAQSSAVTGLWDVTVEGASRNGIIQFELDERDGIIKGHRLVRGGPTLPVQGTVDSSRVVLRFSVPEGGVELPIEIRARLRGDRLSGQAALTLPDGEQVTRRWTATRSSESERVPASYPADPIESQEVRGRSGVTRPVVPGGGRPRSRSPGLC